MNKLVRTNTDHFFDANLLALTEYGEETGACPAKQNEESTLYQQTKMASGDVRFSDNRTETPTTVMNKKIILSSRETEIITLIAEGYTNSEIANRLYLSPFTIDTHRKRVLQKTGARNSAHLVAIAIRFGLI